MAATEERGQPHGDARAKVLQSELMTSSVSDPLVLSDSAVSLATAGLQTSS